MTVDLRDEIVGVKEGDARISDLVNNVIPCGLVDLAAGTKNRLVWVPLFPARYNTTRVASAVFS
jgi:hypothetical protein